MTAYGMVTMSPKGKPVNSKLAKGASAVSQVAAMSGAENVRSLRATIATDESQDEHGEARQDRCGIHEEVVLLMWPRPASPAQALWHG